MTEFTPVSALAGGLMIGAAAVMLYVLLGRIAGISGILNGALTASDGQRGWRLQFLLGLVAGGALYQWVGGHALLTRTDFPLPLLVLAGLLVGFGTRLGSGCTSGHGVCGVARLSTRSLLATAVFLGVGMLTATLMMFLGRGAP